VDVLNRHFLLAAAAQLRPIKCVGRHIMDFPHDAHRALIADFLDAVRDVRDPFVSGEEALASQRLVEDILQKGQAGPVSASA
jgi:predicted dehydrogenase